ncbi:hypothetical protein SAMN06272775_0816 [Streptomyces sp. 2323.1]|nr:hypothetical protein SAMN06272775_0816 [Streptomyces sp. 2323.1]
MPLGDGQMRDDVGEPAAERRGLRPPIGDRPSELPERSVRFGSQIQHSGEPSAALEPHRKSRVGCQHLLQSTVDGAIDAVFPEEREEHGDMRRNSLSGPGIKPFPPCPHSGFGLRDLHDESRSSGLELSGAVVRHRTCVARNLNEREGQKQDHWPSRHHNH